jgi:hypothetical protein
MKFAVEQLLAMLLRRFGTRARRGAVCPVFRSAQLAVSPCEMVWPL